MSSPRLSGILALGVAALAGNPLAAAAIRCPPRLPGPHAGFDQVGPVPAAHWLLRSMRLFDLPPAEQANDPATEVVPRSRIEAADGYTSTWRFTGNDDLLVVCTYNGSGTYYRARLHPPPARCTVQDTYGLRQAWCDSP